MAEHLAVCIARQFGSGGHDIGKALAEEMGIAFYDKELLKAAAEKSGILQELFEKQDERPKSSLLNMPPAYDGKAASFADYAAYLPDDDLQNVIADVIRDAAAKGDCVIIGRCADYVLRGRKKTFSVFIHAELEQRIHRIARLHNLPEDEARALVRKTDKSRANYYSYYTDRSWGLADNYDLALNASRIINDEAVELIHSAAHMFCAE